LPTEAEWEYAAAGGDQNRLYPWGSAALDCTRTHLSSDYPYYCAADGGAVEAVLAVGSFPAGNGRWGHSDLTGNASEWTLDYRATYSTSQTDNYATVQLDYDGPFCGIGMSCHGRTYRSGPRAASRAPWGESTGHVRALGVRCARSAP
jgi:sulfatase modifying factor 1